MTFHAFKQNMRLTEKTNKQKTNTFRNILIDALLTGPLGRESASIFILASRLHGDDLII